MKKGFTLVELLVCLIIASILLLISVSHWGSLNKEQALAKDKLGVISMFEKARSLAVTSKSNSNFGVNISSSTVTVFQGSSYTPGDSNNSYYNLNNLVQVSVITLNGGGSNVLFDRLSGNTSQNGSIKISLKNDPAASTTITIFGSGVVQ